MKNPLSILACIGIAFILLSYRSVYPGKISKEPIKITTWDAYGYYLYLPSILVYKDVKRLSFVDSIEAKYQLSGGNFYQAHIHPKTGNYVFKYLGGIAVLHFPLFLAAHLYALQSSIYAADGFSLPYQTAIGYGVVIYGLIGLFVLRKVLLRFFSDQVSAITLLLLVLASNAIQYFSIDSAQSHAPIFMLYCLVLWQTIRWHEQPGISNSFFTGLIIGIATISRPTEAIMVLIPILWNTHSKEAAKAKWDLVRKNSRLVWVAALGGVIGILPQLIYWQYVTDFFIYDVGSKWRFLDPYFRVLFGFEKGWFIYTPVTLFFVAGFFFMKNQPFRKSVLWFCLLNIWIIISWSDWKYGGSYSTRALMQSYPVFALGLGSFIQQVWNKRWKVLVLLAAVYLIGVNLFQIKQYNETTLHFYDMNKAYYARIYLNPNPSPLDKSLMDNADWVEDENAFSECILVDSDSAQNQLLQTNSLNLLYESVPNLAGIDFLRIDARIEASNGNGFLQCELQLGDSLKVNKVRLLYPGAKHGQENAYSFYVSVPSYFQDARLRIRIPVQNQDTCKITHLKITGLDKLD